MYKDRDSQELPKRVRTISLVVSFDNVENLLSAVKRLRSKKYEGASALYYDDAKEKYYVSLEDVSIKDIKFSFLEEYISGVVGGNGVYVREHFKCLCKKDAVEKLSLCSL